MSARARSRSHSASILAERLPAQPLGLRGHGATGGNVEGRGLRQRTIVARCRPGATHPAGSNVWSRKVPHFGMRRRHAGPRHALHWTAREDDPATHRSTGFCCPEMRHVPVSPCNGRDGERKKFWEPVRYYTSISYAGCIRCTARSLRPRARQEERWTPLLACSPWWACTASAPSAVGARSLRSRAGRGTGRDDRPGRRRLRPGTPERGRPARRGRHGPPALRSRSRPGRLPPSRRTALPLRLPSTAVDAQTLATRSTAMNPTPLPDRSRAVMPI